MSTTRSDEDASEEDEDDEDMYASDREIVETPEMKKFLRECDEIDQRAAYEAYMDGSDDYGFFDEESEIISSDEDDYETGSDGDDDISVLDKVIAFNTDGKPSDSKAQRTEPFLCAGAPSPCYDPYAEPWDHSDRDGPCKHHVLASVAKPKTVIDRRETVSGERRVKDTMCTKCYRFEKEHQRDYDGVHASGLSKEVYNRKIDRRWRKRAKAKVKRDSKFALAKKRMLLFSERASALAAAEAALKDSLAKSSESARPDSPVSSETNRAKRQKRSDGPGSDNSACDVNSTSAASTTDAPAVASPVPTTTASAAAAPVTVDPRAYTQKVEDERALWVTAVCTQLSVVDLKALCRVNNLRVVGCTDELLYRLVKCKLHGSPGPCPTCGNSTVECDYNGDQMVALPAKQLCQHMHGKVKCT